jgi:hypothetical protein
MEHQKQNLVTTTKKTKLQFGSTKYAKLTTDAEIHQHQSQRK